MRREGFEPTQYSRIYSEHFLENDYFTGSRELRKGSVPSIFRFPEGVVQSIKEKQLISLDYAIKLETYFSGLEG